MEVSWIGRARPVLLGDRREIVCIPHQGGRLEIAATAATPHPEVDLLVPGAVIRYRRSFLFGDRFELPSGATVGLADLLGFKLQLAPTAPPPAPIEEDIVRRLMRRAATPGV